MNILVIPTTDWVRHPVPNRLNFIFDEIARSNNVYVLGFNYAKFGDNPRRQTNCTIIPAGICNTNLPLWYVSNMATHRNLIRKSIETLGIDVIVSANILPSYVARGNDVPIVYDYLDVMHEAAGMYIKTPFEKTVVEVLVHEIVSRCIKSATKIITITPGLRNYLISDVFGGKYDRFEDIHVIPNGVDTDIFKPMDCEKEDSIIYVGSLEGWVDFDLPVRALQGTDVGLHVYGTSLHTDYTDKLKNLKLHGVVPYSELPEIINRYKIGLNPLTNTLHNRYSAGGKMFDYLACGVPMLASRYCSPPYTSENEAFRFYNTVEDFKKNVEEMLSLPIDRTKLYQTATKYDWKVLAKEYYKVIEEAVS